MIKEGEKDVTLSYLAEAPKNRLAINTFTDVQTQGQNIRRYSNYLVSRAQGFADTGIDFARSGTGRMKTLSIDKGLLRETESIQNQIRALIKCDVRILINGSAIQYLTFTASGNRTGKRDILDSFPPAHQGFAGSLCRHERGRDEYAQSLL